MHPLCSMAIKIVQAAVNHMKKGRVLACIHSSLRYPFHLSHGIQYIILLSQRQTSLLSLLNVMHAHIASCLRQSHKHTLLQVADVCR